MRASDYPVIKIFLFYLIGFLIGYFVNAPSFIFICITVLLVVLILIFRNKKESFVNILASISVIIFGALIFSTSFYKNDRELKILDAIERKRVLLYGEVSSLGYFDKEKIQFELIADSIFYRGIKFPISQKILVNLDLRESSFSLNYFEKIISPGNIIRISGTLSKPSEPAFLGDFNQRLYLKSKDIDYILQSNNFDELNLIEENKSIFNYKKYLSLLRQKIKFQIENNFDQFESAYIKGLFIAERSDIPEEVKNDFINSGVIHVLAVSGLHTGYITLILLSLFGRFKLAIKVILVALGLFVFSHIANLSPSVVRASLMSIVVLFGLLSQRKNILLNSIAIAGLIILIFNPLDIINPSFQLSFSAVLSIALIYPVLNDYFTKFNLTGFKKFFLDLVLISIAVSIGTFPFVVSYYQKFSLVSLLANLIVIPLTGFILGGIILNLVILNLFPALFSIYKIVLVALINFNFNVVSFFGDLPFAYTTIKNFSMLNSIAYYLVIFIILALIKSKFKPAFKLSVITFVLFNYVYHYDLLDKNLIEPDKDYLIFVKASNSNVIVLNVSNKNFLKLIERSDSLMLIRKDLNRLNQLFENFDFGSIDFASISSNAIFLKNDLQKKLARTNVERVEDNIWLFGKIEKAKAEDNNQNNFNYSFVQSSFTELVQFKDLSLIITPLGIEKLEQKLKDKPFKFICIKPKLDTVFIKLNDNYISSLPLNFEKQRTKIYEINSDGLREVKW